MSDEKEETVPIAWQSTIKGSAQYDALYQAFHHFNRELFACGLPVPIITLSRNSKVVGGYFSPGKWLDDAQAQQSEIGLNANRMAEDDVYEIMQYLIHECVHLAQYSEGKLPRLGYHDRDFAERCAKLGLEITTPDGKQTGQQVSTRARVDELADRAIKSLPDSAILPLITRTVMQDGGGGGGGGGEGPRQGRSKGPRRSGKRSKYTCPMCGLAAWARGGVRLACVECAQGMIEGTVPGEEEG